MEKNNKKRILTSRISKSQKIRLLEMLREHKTVAKGHIPTKAGKIEHRAVWKAIAKELNSMDGSYKNADQWKKTWIDWKFSVKKQYSQQQFINQSRNKSSSQRMKPMNPMEQEVLEFSREIIEGYTSTPEEGFDFAPPPVEACCIIKEEYIVPFDEEVADDAAFSFLESEEFSMIEQPSTSHKAHNLSEVPATNSNTTIDSSQSEVMKGLNGIQNLLKTQNELLSNILLVLQKKN